MKFYHHELLFLLLFPLLRLLLRCTTATAAAADVADTWWVYFQGQVRSSTAQVSGRQTIQPKSRSNSVAASGARFAPSHTLLFAALPNTLPFAAPAEQALAECTCSTIGFYLSLLSSPSGSNLIMIIFSILSWSLAPFSLNMIFPFFLPRHDLCFLLCFLSLPSWTLPSFLWSWYLLSFSPFVLSDHDLCFLSLSLSLCPCPCRSVPRYGMQH